MAASYKFSSLPNINIPRTAMKVECTHPTSFNHGKIIPLFCIPAGPAENYKLYLDSFIRMQNPIFPFYGDIKVFIHSFFVPMRLVWEHTEEFFGENVLSKGPQPIEYKIPSMGYGDHLNGFWDKVTLGDSDITGASATSGAGYDVPWIGSVSHYLGKPLPVFDYLGSSGPGTHYYEDQNIPVSVLKERAFWLIYNEYYRPQQLIDPIYVAKGDSDGIGKDPNRKSGATAVNLSFATPVPTCTKMYDYFRSATTSPIYADGPVEIPVDVNFGLLPLVNDATKLYDVNEVDFDSAGSEIFFGPGHSGISQSGQVLSNYFDSVSNPLLVYGGASVTTGDQQYIFSGPWNEDDDLSTLTTSLYADGRSLGAIAGDVDKLRYLFAQYNFLYRDNFGTRYPEIIQTHFNLKPSIAILQRPELLHEGSFSINVSQVLSTAGATDDSNTKLGQPGANSVSANNQLVVNKSIEEWGFIFIMLETKHRRVYSSGINAYDLRRTKFDFYFPEFAQIGNKKIMNAELSVDIAPAQGDDTKYSDVWGYQEAWAEERYFINHVSGLLDPRAPSSYSYMSLAEEVDPDDNAVINGDFVMEDREAIANVLVSGQNGPDYTGDFALTGVMAKPMPLYSDPGLIDHIGAW